MTLRAMMATETTASKSKRCLIAGLLASCTFAGTLVGAPEQASAQEILLTGPLAGAPAVRKLRLHREGRFEFAPNVSFTLLDEYQRTIFLGARLNYNFTDWLALGVWGAYGGLIQLPTGLSNEIQGVNEERKNNPGDLECQNLNCKLTQVNLGEDFIEQLGSLDWVAAPQITVVPFRGKLALFQSVFLDSDLYFFGGPAFVGVTERGDCGAGDDGADQCTESFEMASRMAIAPTFGLGFTFYVNKWSALGFEWRGMPFSWNSPGFDTAGGGQNKEFPDNRITEDDRQFKFNNMMTISYNIYFPMEYTISE